MRLKETAILDDDSKALTRKWDRIPFALRNETLCIENFKSADCLFQVSSPRAYFSRLPYFYRRGTLLPVYLFCLLSLSMLNVIFLSTSSLVINIRKSLHLVYIWFVILYKLLLHTCFSYSWYIISSRKNIYSPNNLNLLYRSLILSILFSNDLSWIFLCKL